MIGTTFWCGATPAGVAMSPATKPMPHTEQTTIASVCQGVMPRGLEDSEVMCSVPDLQYHGVQDPEPGDHEEQHGQHNRQEYDGGQGRAAGASGDVKRRPEGGRQGVRVRLRGSPRAGCPRRTGRVRDHERWPQVSPRS
jgi:hypothetical protein